VIIIFIKEDFKAKVNQILIKIPNFYKLSFEEMSSHFNCGK